MTPQPYIPQWKNLKVFVLGALWCAIGGALGAIVEMGDAFIAKEQIEWPHVERITGYGIAAALTSYYRKYKALITPVPEQVQ